MSLRYLAFALFRTVIQVPFGYMKPDLEWRAGKKKLRPETPLEIPSPTSIPNQASYIRMVLELQCGTRQKRGT